jgi:hypothetical protein
MRQISGKLLPRELRKRHKENCFFTVLELLEFAIN